MRFEIRGKAKEMLFKNDTTVKFLIEDDTSKEIVCTLGKHKLDLLNEIQMGQEYVFNVVLLAHRIEKNNKNFINNVVFVDEVSSELNLEDKE